MIYFRHIRGKTLKTSVITQFHKKATNAILNAEDDDVCTVEQNGTAYDIN